MRVAERALVDRLSARAHFLGALVHQQAGNPTGYLQEWTVIDGQQRLTTLQLLLSAIHGQLVEAQIQDPAKRVLNLIENEPEYREREHDRFKVWPTNRDRAAFRAVMEAEPPIDYGQMAYRASRVVQAHRFFSEEVRRWLEAEGEAAIVDRAVALERTVSELIEMVVIRLGPTENAQEIFETLNARGAQLTAADLIKNFVFQELMEANDDVESIYDEYWSQFETPFWEAEISLGRYHHVRSSAFLYHWLVARTPTKEPMLAGEVFERFKEYATQTSRVKMSDLIAQIYRASEVYRRITWIPPGCPEPLSAVDLFSYRISVLQSEVVKPVLLLLLDPEQEAVPNEQLEKGLGAIESWLVRRSLVRAGTKSHTKVFVDLANVVRSSPRSTVGNAIQEWLEQQTSEEARWPDNREVREALRELPVYRLLSRGRLRMVLEAIEDDLRGYRRGRKSLAEGRAPRGVLSIEHVMPQRWQGCRAWPLPRGVAEDDRQELIHTLGNLTLVTSPLNSTMKRAQWMGPNGKRLALKANSILHLNRQIVDAWPRSWTEASIQERTETLIASVLKIWPAPTGHKVAVEHRKTATMRDVAFGEFLEAGIVAEGDNLYPIPRKWIGTYATVLADGRLLVNETACDSPRDAQKEITGKSHAGGWRFFALNPDGSRSLRTAWLDAQEEDPDDTETVEDGEEVEEVSEL